MLKIWLCIIECVEIFRFWYRNVLSLAPPAQLAIEIEGVCEQLKGGSANEVYVAPQLVHFVV